MPQKSKVYFDENGDRCPKNIQKLRRLPECGIFDRDFLPFTPDIPPVPPTPPSHHPFQPFGMRGVPGALSGRSIPDFPERPNPRFPGKSSTLVGGATGPGSEFDGVQLPQDETNIFQAKAVREIEPRPGFSRLVNRPAEAQSTPLPRQLESANFRNQEFDNVAGTIDDILQSRTTGVELQDFGGPTESEMNAAIQSAMEETGDIVDDGAGVIPRPRREPTGDPREDEEFGPEPSVRPPPRRFKRPTGSRSNVLQPRRLDMDAATIPQEVELQQVIQSERLPTPQVLRQRTPQQRLAGMRNVEEDTPTTPGQGTELESFGEDVRDRPPMSGSKRKGDYFEVEQGSPSRFRPNASRGRAMSQLQNRASQMAKNIELAAQATKRARTAMVEAVASRARGTVQDIQAATVRQFGQGYERVVTDAAGIRRAQMISGERPVGGGRTIPQDIEMGVLRTPVATLDDGSVTVRRPITEDVTGLRDIDLDFSPFDEVRDLPTVAGRTTAPKLSFSERIQMAREGVTARGLAEGGGKAGISFLAGMGVAQLMGGTDYTGNRFANASIVGGASGASGDVVTRTAGLIGQKAAIKMGVTSAEDAAIFTATKAGTALLRGGAEGLGVGIVAAPLDLLLNDALVNSGMSHMGANVISSTTIGLGTTATIGAISLAAAPETAGLSILVGLAATAVSGIVGLATGKAEDDQIEEAKRNQQKLRTKVTNVSNARKKLLTTLPQHDYDFDEALTAFPKKGSLDMNDDTWSVFSTHAKSLFNKHPDNRPPPAPGSGGDNSPDQIRLNQLFQKYIQHQLIRQVCTGVGSQCNELRSRDTGALTEDEINFLNEKTANMWQVQADMQVTMSIQELQYTQARIKHAKQSMISLWNDRRLLPNQMDDYTRETAYLDPKFEEKFKNAIKLDAQQQVVNAYYDNQTKFEQLPPNIQTAAGYDPAFKGLMDTFYTDMEDTASNLEVTIPQLIQLQRLTGEAQRDKYQEFQFDRIKTQEPVVEQASELVQEQDAVRAAGFYDIDQAYLETDPTAIGQWHPSDSQILQAHAAGMNLNQYVSYMHQLALGEAGDYTKLPTYTEEQLRQSGLLDYSHLQDELQKAGYRRDLYIYDPTTRLFTINPNVPGLPDQEEAKSFISQYTPKYLAKARQEYADMIHGLNEKNQAQVDAYNTNLYQELSVYGNKYNEMVRAQNDYLMSEAGSAPSNLLFFHLNDVFNQYRIEYNPLSDSLPTKDKKVVNGNLVSAPNIPGRRMESERDRKKREAAEALGMTSTQYEAMKHNLQNDGYDFTNITDQVAQTYAANTLGMKPGDYQQYKQDVQNTSTKLQNIRRINPGLSQNVTFTDQSIDTLEAGGSVKGSDNQIYASA